MCYYETLFERTLVSILVPVARLRVETLLPAHRPSQYITDLSRHLHCNNIIVINECAKRREAKKYEEL
jgi:hypothetical protein